MPRLGHYGILAAAFVLTALAGTANAENAWNNYHWARTTNYFVLQTVGALVAIPRACGHRVVRQRRKEHS